MRPETAVPAGRRDARRRLERTRPPAQVAGDGPPGLVPGLASWIGTRATRRDSPPPAEPRGPGGRRDAARHFARSSSRGISPRSFRGRVTGLDLEGVPFVHTL